MILITTPTGNTGSLILRTLAESGQPVRAFARDLQKLPADLRDKIEIAQGSLLNADEFAQALEGCDIVYYCIPQSSTPDDVIRYYEEYATVAVQAMRMAGTRRVVYLSGAGHDSPLAQAAGTATGLFRAEDILAASGLSTMALRCPPFFESLLWQIEAIARAGMFFVAIPGDAKHPQVAVRDIADVAVRWLLDESWQGVNAVGVLGPMNISHNDIAAALTNALGKPIHFVPMSREQNRENLTQHGINEVLADGVGEMFEAIGNGLIDAEPRTPQSTTPTTIRQWIDEVFVPQMNAVNHDVRA